MKINSILLITFCLLQVLNCATVGLNEQSLKNAAIKTLKYARMYHQDTIKLNDKDVFTDLKFNYSPLASDNIQFRFDEYGLLHIKFINLKTSIKGGYAFPVMFFKIFSEFTAQLNNFNWEQVFVVSQKDLGNGKLDIKFKSTEESAVNFSIFKYTVKNNDIKDKMKEQIIKLKTLDFTPVKTELKKVAQLILETLQSDLK